MLLNDIADHLDGNDADAAKRLLTQVFDKDLTVTKKIYQKLNPECITQPLFNMFAWSAAHFQ